MEKYSDEWFESIPANALSISIRRPVHGVGINNAPFKTGAQKENGLFVQHSGYRKWTDMLKRCYCIKSVKRGPTYQGCNVCDEWLEFMSFLSWFKKNSVPGWHLDKDLLLNGNKTYSPDTCVFVPSWVNSFLSDCRAKRGKYPIGVHYNKVCGVFQSRCNNPITGEREHLGHFRDPVDAHFAWYKRKLELVSLIGNELDSIDDRLRAALINKLNSMRCDR